MSDTEAIDYPAILGFYKHYKGGIYHVHTMAKHTETDEPMVVYQSVEFSSMHVRPLSNWNMKVIVDDEEQERFTYIDVDENEE